MSRARNRRPPFPFGGPNKLRSRAPTCPLLGSPGAPPNGRKWARSRRGSVRSEKSALLSFFVIGLYGICRTLRPRKGIKMKVSTMDEHISSERAELHFLAALVEELMRKMHIAGVLSQAELNEIEQAVAQRIGGTPRAW